MILVVAAVYVSTRHRTEAGFQRNALARVTNLPVGQVESISLRSRWATPEREVVLDKQKDKTDIARLMKAIKDDLRVVRKEVNPNGAEPPPAYDVVLIRTTEGKTLSLNCWIGKEGGDNPSLTIRSRDGEFKRLTQDLLRRKGVSLTKK